MSESKEIAVGKESDPQIVASFGKYEDAKIQAFITKKGKEMAAVSHRPNLNFEFKVLDSPVVNAFAVPGGYVYFTRGILAHFNNEAEFAGVLGHEIGHVTARHSAKQYTSQMLGQGAFLAGILLSEDFRQYAGEASQGMQLLFLKFGRDNESESDELGVEYSTKIGYDAKEMADFFQTLKRLTDDGGGRVPTFLSTHPDPADRYTKVGQLAEKWRKSTNEKLKVNRNAYLRMIDGLIYGEDPRQGYVENDQFYHPELKFQYPVPANWRTVNSPAQVQMAPADGKAIMVFAIAQGTTPEAAANDFVKNNQLQLNDSGRLKVNGLEAFAVTAQNDKLRVRSYFIQYNNLIYNFQGIASLTDFANYQNDFEYTMRNFDSLSDLSKINVNPEKIKIKTVGKTASLTEVFRTLDMPTQRFKELAILNGMELTDQVIKGTLIKVIGK
ncbi:MAG: M48 family metalloprotease [Saprospiraceae bacterium]